MPSLHLIPYKDSSGEQVLRLCEDSTGLLLGPTDRRLSSIGIYVSQLRGERYYSAACRMGDFRPGRPVALHREPDNEFDSNALVVFDESGTHLAAYVNKQKARSLSNLIDSGTELRAISIRGTASGKPCDQVAILAASPHVVAHLLAERPAHFPRPAGPHA